MLDNLFVQLGLSLAIGLLVGVERGWREREAPAGSRTAGVRTYGLSGLLGGILAALSQALGSGVIFASGFIGFSAVFGWFSWREAAHDESFSVTGVVAALAVFGLGGLAVSGDYRAAAAAGVALAALLASREVLHGLLKRISWAELRSAILLAGMTAIVLPLMPNRTIDPWGGVNPWEIWLFTVLTAAISYGGYIGIRILGPAKGVLVSAMAGALVSSTAVTLAFARRARAGEPVRPLAAGAALAAMISILRVLTIVAIVRSDLAVALIAPAAAAAVVFGPVGGALFRGNVGATGGDPRLGNPFDLTPLLIFAASFAVVAGASAALTRYVGPDSVIMTSALSGAFDVDVASLAAARLAGEVIPITTAAAAILAALTVNAVARIVLAMVSGPLRYAMPLLGATVLAAAAGATALVFVAGAG